LVYIYHSFTWLHIHFNSRSLGRLSLNSSGSIAFHFTLKTILALNDRNGQALFCAVEYAHKKTHLSEDSASQQETIFDINKIVYGPPIQDPGKIICVAKTTHLKTSPRNPSTQSFL